METNDSRCESFVEMKEECLRERSERRLESRMPAERSEQERLSVLLVQLLQGRKVESGANRAGFGSRPQQKVVRKT
ncbi:hypothetical protein ZOD2009_07174 [Haladaptatus paucihalophilus DX253]|uniref:Uncharacterized protein n=1 Tax=Haladaptatus paucihalophilus DX253 TaxID=797209 RepID=E7QRL2_HALPU|nr:hypothetical protein ZOD2009_07174 [Haladaptatus paucihalophilus DX253]SHK17158.1 hypothetical protein SAMN05444342_0825 [Haladaptatus paucihalophilus DX253]